MHDIDDLERRGIPSVMVASLPFRHAAEIQARALGLDVARVLVDHPVQDRTDSEMVAMADSALREVLSLITRSS